MDGAEDGTRCSSGDDSFVMGPGGQGVKRSLGLGSRVVSCFYCVLQVKISRLSIRYAKIWQQPETYVIMCIMQWVMDDGWCW